jgi:hypothetical protein
MNDKELQELALDLQAALRALKVSLKPTSRLDRNYSAGLVLELADRLAYEIREAN